MASKVSPSSRLVFCLLISAAVLRPGKRLASEKPQRRRGVADRGRFPGWPGAVRSSVCLAKYGSHKGARGHRSVPGNSHLCHTL